MQEQNDVDFDEPVVLVRTPFQMVTDVARETVNRTHALVVRLTRKEADMLSDADSAATPDESR